MSYLLSVVLFMPLAGALLLMFVPREEEGVIRGIGLGMTIITFLCSIGLWTGFDTTASGYQFVNDRTWIAGISAHYKVGIDGISLWLVLLTTFLTPIVLLSAHKSITRKVKEFIISFLILETGMIGAFVALDLFLFYVMWEIMLIPMYFVIGIWGGDRKTYASIKFVIYTMVGSLLMLVAIFYLYVQHRAAGGANGVYSFDLQSLYSLQLSHSAQVWCFLAFSLAFAIKVPLFPLHTWLPDAHVEAPTPGSVILAGVLLKFGIFGFLRFSIPMFPYAANLFGPYLIGLAVIGIIYGAWVAFAQDDVKKLVAYSSVSHLGFCVLGAFSFNLQGMEGSMFAMLSHGLTTSGLFLGIGMLYERRHTRKLADFGGIWAKMPLFGAFFLIVTLGSVGLPGLSGFVGEFLSLLGGYDAGRSLNVDVQVPGHVYMQMPQLWASIGTLGVIFGAVYLLYMFQKVMFGPNTNPKNQSLRDLSAREIVVFLPIIVGVFVMGIYPKPFLNAMEPSLKKMRADYVVKLRDTIQHAELEAHFVTELVPPAEPAPAAPAPAGVPK